MLQDGVSNETYKEIVSRLNLLSVLHRIKVAKMLHNSGMHFSQHHILVFIGKNPNCSQRDIASVLRVSPPSIAVSVKRMERSGLVKKSADKKDARYSHLNLTEKGRAAVENSTRIFSQIDEKMFADFTAQECEIFRSYLDRLIVNMNGEKLENDDVFSLIAQEKELFIKEKKEEIK